MNNKYANFWNKEYKSSEHLALSTTHSEDLEKFTRFLERDYKKEFLNSHARAVDIGCGNGRNLIYLAENYGMRGFGYDVSDVAIEQARAASEGMPIDYDTFDLTTEDQQLPQQGGTATLVLDMMTSHFLRKEEREKLREEIIRILRTGGWLFFKSFLADEDLHTKRLLKENPADEDGAYIHPKLGVYEYVWTEKAVREFFEGTFEMHKFHKSHKHIHRGRSGAERAGKRRTFSAYLQKM